MSSFRHIVFYFVCLFFSLTLAQTPGGTVINNQATVDYRFLGLTPSATSNEVSSTVPDFCSLIVSPDGSVATPAYTQTAIPGGTVYFPYTLQYTGNIVTDIDVTALIDPATTVPAGSTVSVILDGNNNGLFDTGETSTTQLSNVALSSTTSLLLAVNVSGTLTSEGFIYVNLQANCAGSSTFDNDNISVVDVLEGGVIGLAKTSVPASGTSVEAGGDIAYSVGFTVNERALDNVVITDVLDDAIAPPSALNVTVNGTLRTAPTYNAATRTVTASLGTLQPNDEVILTIATRVLVGTSGGTTINNEATLSFTGGSIDTNTVTHTTPSTCAVVIQPNGSLTRPAFTETALPGETVVLPYTLRNAGNVSNDFLLETAFINGALTPTISIILDANNNEVVDAGEVSVTSLSALEVGETVSLLVVLTMPSTTETNGDVFVNLIGRCSSDPSIADDDNLSSVSVPVGGYQNLQKTSEPANGSILYPGALLSYFVTFEARGRDLSDVVITDVLDEHLEVPSSFTTGELRDDESGLTANVLGSYDVATRTITWRLASVPATMKVRLEIVTSVKADLQPQNEEIISNTAMFSSSDSPETSTNTVTHPLNKLEILLQKTASPEQVFVGDTLNYTLTIINPEDSIALRELILTDTLPDELRYQPGTAKVKLPERGEEALEPTVDGQKLTWTLPGLETTQQIVVTFGTDVLAAAAQVEELVNTAEVVASDANGRAVADAAANAATVVDKGLFTAPAVLLGTVFEDLNNNTIYDEASDVPIAGVRLYLTDGRSVVSDDLGRYTFLELRAGIEVVKVDSTTLPARLLAETKTEARPGLWRVRLEEGLITRQDVPLLPPGARVAVSQSLNVVMGNLRIQKYVLQSATNTQVVLEVSSTEALRDVVLQDVLPQGISQSGEIVSDDINITFDNLTFNLGDIASDYKAVIYYSVQLPEGADTTDLLLAPTITWSVRP